MFHEVAHAVDPKDHDNWKNQNVRWYFDGEWKTIQKSRFYNLRDTITTRDKHGHTTAWDVTAQQSGSKTDPLLGFVDPYGTTNSTEDIATFVEAVRMLHHTDNDLRMPFGDSRADFSAYYAHAKYLLDQQFITPEEHDTFTTYLAEGLTAAVPLRNIDWNQKIALASDLVQSDIAQGTYDLGDGVTCTFREPIRTRSFHNTTLAILQEHPLSIAYKNQTILNADPSLTYLVLKSEVTIDSQKPTARFIERVNANRSSLDQLALEYRHWVERQ